MDDQTQNPGGGQPADPGMPQTSDTPPAPPSEPGTGDSGPVESPQPAPEPQGDMPKPEEPQENPANPLTGGGNDTGGGTGQ